MYAANIEKMEEVIACDAYSAGYQLGQLCREIAYIITGR